jgi:hypothetical protein
VYRLPSIHELIGVKQSQLDEFDVMTFELTVHAVGPDGATNLRCDKDKWTRCRIVFYRKYTPILHNISPQVVYFDSMVGFNFDPMSVTDTIRDLKSDELPFINAKIGNALVDFEFNVDYSHYIRHWALNQVRGRVGDQPVGKSQKI